MWILAIKLSIPRTLKFPRRGKTVPVSSPADEPLPPHRIPNVPAQPGLPPGIPAYPHLPLQLLTALPIGEIDGASGNPQASLDRN